MPQERLESTNIWIRAEDWYPEALSEVIWFGDDGTGNFLGWKPSDALATMWNSEDEEPWKIGSNLDVHTERV
jgi:hypothetical protein